MLYSVDRSACWNEWELNAQVMVVVGVVVVELSVNSEAFHFVWNLQKHVLWFFKILVPQHFFVWYEGGGYFFFAIFLMKIHITCFSSLF